MRKNCRAGELTRILHKSEWSSWDIENKKTREKIQVKQSAACQIWSAGSNTPAKQPSFGIPKQKNYWGPDCGKPDKSWVSLKPPKRIADLYIFAWCGRSCDESPDHRDPDQWEFFIVPSKKLPEDQKSIGLNGVRQLVKPVGFKQIDAAVTEALRDQP